VRASRYLTLTMATNRRVTHCLLRNMHIKPNWLQHASSTYHPSGCRPSWPISNGDISGFPASPVFPCRWCDFVSRWSNMGVRGLYWPLQPSPRGKFSASHCGNRVSLSQNILNYGYFGSTASKWVCLRLIVNTEAKLQTGINTPDWQLHRLSRTL
jgi:hypothetical protein